MALTDRNVAAVGREAEDTTTTTEDLVDSASSMWPPRTVIKRHRKKATLIWIVLLMAFSVYVGYVVWDTVDARKNPAASIELKQNPFTFPDVELCADFLSGCLTDNVDCLEYAELWLSEQTGFMDEPDDFDPADYSDVDKVTEAFPNCAVMPLSKLTVNEAGVNDGSITSFGASFYMIWPHDPYGDYNATEHNINEQYISTRFIDIEQDLQQIGEKSVDVKLPYELVDATRGDWFPVASNHMVISLAEFSGITEAGERKEREQTYSQTTTTGKDNWFWTRNSTVSGISILKVEMLITKFEYTSVVQVDPVDIWAIIGAVAGVWQFVAVAFGVFFVFSEKQPPDKKMRDLYKTVFTPAIMVNKRLSIITSSRSSQQDVEMDATDEDLPPGWVKRQRKSGSVYYFHIMTGSTRVYAPHESDDTRESTRATAAPRRQTGIRSLFRVAHDPQGSGLGGSHHATQGTNNGESLPPGWRQRTDGDGRVYFVDTVRKTTQWHRPAWRVLSTSGRRVQAVDTPMRHTRRSSSRTTLSQASASPAAIPSTTTAVTGEAVDEPLPPC